VKDRIGGLTLVSFLGLAGLIPSVCGQAKEIPPSKIPAYYDTINEAAWESDASRMVSILVELDSVRFWSFGAGLGPTDAQAIQVTALEAFADHLLDDERTVAVRSSISERCPLLGPIPQNQLVSFHSWPQLPRIRVAH